VALARSRVEQLARAVLRAEGVRHALVSIAFVRPRTIAHLNYAHLGHRGPTDVLAFAFAPHPSIRARRGRQTGDAGVAPTRARTATARTRHAHVAHARYGIVGDVYIAPAVARRNAVRCHVGIREELARLVVHGILHVVGYDHSEGPDRIHTAMWRRQEGLLHRLGGARA
jgi:probable rRNA maturation factor